jgi:hypothetical protein
LILGSGKEPNNPLITRASLPVTAACQTVKSVGCARMVVLSQETNARNGIPPGFLLIPQLADKVGTDTLQPEQDNGILNSF